MNTSVLIADHETLVVGNYSRDLIFTFLEAFMTMEELVLEIKAIYKPLFGKTFQGSIHEKDTDAVSTGGPRDIVNVDDTDVCQIMGTIVQMIKSKFEESVWKGITMSPTPRLWVTSYEGDEEETTFTVDKIEVVTGLNWQMSYQAMVNITLV